ncbi:MAG: aldo/keto reductase [Gammaproteobacteria bacterium]
MTLELVPLGRTGLQVTRLGLGLAALGRPGYINLGHGEDLGSDKSRAALRARCHALLDAAWRAGMRYFDAARSYGRAEEFLALWLDRRGYLPVVGSKWGYKYTADWAVDAELHEHKEHSLARFEEQWHQSWRLLGDRLAVYQVHSATLDSGLFEDAALLGRLAGLKAAGVRLGISLSGPRQAQTLARAVEVRVDGRRLFDTVQATWNLLEPSAGSALAAARREGMGVIVKEALANGRLAGRDAAAELAVLRVVAAELGATVDAVAIAAALAEPWADVVLSGAATEAQLAANLTALEVSLDGRRRERLAALAEAPEAYWARRAALAWN